MIKMKSLSVFYFLIIGSIFPGTFTFCSASNDLVKKQLAWDSLENGLQYYVQPLAQSERASIYLVLKTGSVDEKVSESGYAHFIEHLAFYGGKRLPGKSFLNYLTDKGLEVGVHYNALTSYESTIFKIDLPFRADSDTQEKIFQFFADIIDGLTLKALDIDIERKVVLEEMLLSEKPDQLHMFRLTGSIYEDKLAIGTKESILRANKTKLSAFYQRCYGPGNAAIFLTGNFDDSATDELIAKTLGRIPKNNFQEERIKSGMFDTLKDSVGIIQNPNQQKTSVFIDFCSRHVKNPAVESLKDKLVSNLIARMLRRRVDTLLEGEIRNLSIDYAHFLSDIGCSAVQFNTEKQIREPICMILTEIRRMAEHGVPQKLLHDLTNQQKKRIIDKNRRLTPVVLMESCVDNFLSDRPIVSPDFSDSLQLSLLKNISVQDIKEKALAIWDQTKVRVLIQSDGRSELINEVFSLDEMRRSVRRQALTPLPYQAEDKPESPTIAEIQTLNDPLSLKSNKPILTKHFDQLDIHHYIYKNGVQLFLKPMQGSEKQIRLFGFAAGGTSSIPDSIYDRYESTVSYMDLGGVGNLNIEELDSYLEDKEFGVTVNISEFERNIFAYTQSEQVPEFLKFVYLKMTAAHGDEKEFRLAIAEELKTLSNPTSITFSSDSMDILRATLKNLYFPGRSSASTSERLKLLDLGEMQSFYDQAFANGKGWKFVMVGDFNMDEIKPLLNRYLGGLPSSSDTLTHRQLFDRDHYQQEYIIPSEEFGNSTKSCLIFYGNYTSSAKNSLMAAILEKHLKTMIFKSLREERGLVYTPQVFLEKHVRPSEFLTLQVYYECAFENTAIAKELTVAVIKEAIDQSLTEGELTAYKRAVLIDFMSVYKNESTYLWASDLIKRLAENESLEVLEDYEQVIKEITIDEFSEFVKSSLQPVNFKEIHQ